MLRINKKYILCAYSIAVLTAMMRPLTDIYVTYLQLDVEAILIVVLSIPYMVWMCLNLRKVLRLVKTDWLLVALLSLAVVSICWTISIPLSVSGLTALLWGSSFAWYLCVRFTFRECILIVVISLAMVLILSVVVSIGIPSIGLRTRGGQWQGGFGHKNTLGRFMLVSAVTNACLIFSQRKTVRILAIVGYVCSMLVLLFAGSTTGLLSFAGFIGFLPLMIILSKIRYRFFRKTVVLLLLFVSIISVFLGLENLSEYSQIIFQVIGRNPELTTIDVRLELWEYLYPFVQEKPFLGYGYNAFWTSEGRAFAMSMSSTDWVVFQAHNGFFELVLQLGLIGLILMIIHLVVTIRVSFTVFLKKKRTGMGLRLWPLAYIFMLLIMNLTYSAILGQLTVIWIMYLVASYQARSIKHLGNS